MRMPKLLAMRHLRTVPATTRTTHTLLRQTMTTTMPTAHPKSQPSHAGGAEAEAQADLQKYTLVLQKWAKMGANPARRSRGSEADL